MKCAFGETPRNIGSTSCRATIGAWLMMGGLLVQAEPSDLVGPRHRDERHRFLERIQTAAYHRLGEELPGKSTKRKTLYHVISKQCELDETTIPDSEDPISFCLARPFFELALAKMVEIDDPVRTDIVFGTLPYNTLAAQTIPLRGSEESVVVINRGLFLYCYDLLSVAVNTISIKRTTTALPWT